MLVDGMGIYFCGINPHEVFATSNACVVDDVAEAVERHHESRLVHVERVRDRGLGLLVRLGVDQPCHLVWKFWLSDRKITNVTQDGCVWSIR